MAFVLTVIALQSRSLKSATCPSVVFVTPSGFCGFNSRHQVSLVAGALSGGADLIQIRDRDASLNDLERTTELLVGEFDDATVFSMNGPFGIELAHKHPGLGVHLRQVDVIPHMPAARSLRNRGYLSCSAHSVQSVKTAIDHGKVDYLQVGTMFTTATHPGKQPEGTQLLRKIRETFPNAPPLVGIGGIDNNRAVECISHGADGVAVITAISQASNPQQATFELKNAVESAKSTRT